MGLTFWAEITTIVSAVLAIAGLIYAADQIRLSKVATSATLVVELNNSLRKAWMDYLREEGEDLRAYLLGDVMDTLKLAETLQKDRLFSGKSGKLIRKVLANQRRAMQEDEQALQHLDELDAAGSGSRLADLVRRSRA